MMSIEAFSGSKPLFHVIVPVRKHTTKKNGKTAFYSKRLNKAWVTTKKSARTEEEKLIETLLIVKKTIKDVTFPITEEIHAEFIFNMSDYYTKKGERRKNLPDLSNLIELPQDALEKAGIIENDSLIYSLDGSRRLPSEQDTLEITLWRKDF